MASQKIKALSGIVLTEQVAFTLTELCSICGVGEELVVEMVNEGVIDPRGQSPTDWQFSGRMLVRMQRALRLHRDLQVNWPGAALALDLLEALERRS